MIEAVCPDRLTPLPDTVSPTQLAAEPVVQTEMCVSEVFMDRPKAYVVAPELTVTVVLFVLCCNGL